MSQAAVAEGTSDRPWPTKPPDSGPVTPADWQYHAILLVLCFSVLVAAALLSIRNRSQVIIPLLGLPLPELCTMRRFLGMDCPGCGLTRCFISLAHGNLRDAWSYNPAGLWMFGLFAIQIPYRGTQLWRIHRGQPEIMLPWAAVIAFAILGVALLAQWSLRLAGVSF